MVTGADPGRRRPVELSDRLYREWASGHAHNPDGRLLLRWAGELGIAPQVTLETEDLHGILAMIRVSFAVGLMPASHVDTGRAVSVEKVVRSPGALQPHRDVLDVRRAGAGHPSIGDLISLVREVV